MTRSGLDGRQRHLANTGRGKQFAEAGSFDLLADALLLRIDGRHRSRRRALCVQDRTAEISGQRRSKGRGLAGETGIVPRKTSQSVGDILMVGCIVLGWRGYMRPIVLQRTVHSTEVCTRTD